MDIWTSNSKLDIWLKSGPGTSDEGTPMASPHYPPFPFMLPFKHDLEAPPATQVRHFYLWIQQHQE